MLKSHVALARERKQILSVLASLVTQARKSSSQTLADDADRARETDIMLNMADQVLENVHRFVQVAQRCGVALDVGSAVAAPFPQTIRIASRTSSEPLSPLSPLSPLGSRTLDHNPDDSVSSAASSDGPLTPGHRVSWRQSAKAVAD